MVVGGGVKGRNISLILIPRLAGAGKGRSLEGGGVWQRGRSLAKGERKFEGRRLKGKKYCFQFMKPKIIIIIRCRHTNLVFMSTVLFINHCSIEM